MKEILKAFSKTSSGTIISLILSSISVKIIASILGPSGIGLFSLLKQIQGATLMLATMSGQTALVQGAVSREGKERDRYLKTVLILFSITGITVSLGLILLAPFLANNIIHRADDMAIDLIRLLAIPVFLSTLTGYAGGVLNVDRALGYMALVQILAGFVTVAIAYPVSQAIHSGWEYATIIYLVASQLLTLLLYGLWLHRNGKLSSYFQSWHKTFDRDDAKYFLSFAGVTVISGILNNFMMLGIRGSMVATGGLSMAGIFDSAWTLCISYMSLITGSFGAYYLPTLTQCKNKQEIRHKIQSMLLFVNLLGIPLIITALLSRDFIINILFSSEFLGGSTLLKYLMFADYFRLLSWTLAFPMLAFAHLKLFIITETIWNVAMFGSFYWVLHTFNSLEAIGWCVLGCYLTYTIFTLIYAWHYYQFIPSWQNISIFIFGSISISMLVGYQTVGKLG
jgi:O-antigen/teichoic acid export membrane protein